MTRPTHAAVSLSALRNNLSQARRIAGAARIWAVVKADAYGHGLQVARQAFDAADGFALVEFDRAVTLRRLDWSGPILMLEGAFDPDDVRTAAQHRLSLVVHEPRQIDWLARLPGPASIPVNLKLNSGMNRLGFPPAALREAWSRLSRLAAVESVTLMTHLANADLEGGAGDAIRIFDEVTAGLPGERSIANSAALLALPGSARDWVRPGVMLYGASPFADRSAAQFGLRPGMRLGSRLIAVQKLQPGDAVGYGSIWTAPRKQRIGVVACGYADGYPRHAPNGTPVLVDGVRTQTVGRVAMDMMMVDLEPVPQAGIGSEVELWGDALPIDDVAKPAGTIGYELMCALAPRVPVRIEP